MQINLKAKDLFKHQIGDGTNAKIYQDWWVGKEKISPQQEIGSNLTPHSTVEDLITNGHWNAAMIWRNFTRTEASDILSISLPSTQTPDTFSWSHNQKGIYTAKSGYWSSLNATNNHNPNRKHKKKFKDL